MRALPPILATVVACAEREPLPADLDSAESVARGRALFVEHCAICHGEKADGQGLRRSALSVPPRDFTQPDWRERMTPADVYVVIRDGKPGTPMPSWRPLGDEALWDLVSYVRSVPGPVAP